MSDTVIPPWKQELLKRRERNAKLSKQENSTGRSTSTVWSHRTSGNSETARKDDVSFGRQPSLDQNVSEITKKVKPGSREFVLEDSVDGVGSGTRRQKEHKSSHFQLTSKRGITISSPLNHPNESSAHAKAGDYDKNILERNSVKTSKREDASDISRLDREYLGDKSSSFGSITLDDSDKGRLKSLLSGDRGVDKEHIRPKDVKRMWKRQESKEEFHLEPQNIKDNYPNRPNSLNQFKKDVFNDINKKSGNPRVGNTIGNPPQVNASAAGTSAPKAYKSPYAKQGWSRQSPSSNNKNHEKNAVLHVSQSKGPDKTEGILTLDNKSGSSVKDLPYEKVDDDHIPSVKSLLGLFGGRRVTNVNQKPQNDSSHVHRTGKGAGHSHPLSPRPKASDHSSFNLSRHHSEPNLYSASNSLQLSGSQNGDNLQSHINKATLANKSVALPSHHVSRGIEERMSRLRRASLSSMEEMEDLVVIDKIAGSDSQAEKSEVNKDALSVLDKKNICQTKEEVADKNLLNMMKKVDPFVSKNSVYHHGKDSAYIEKHSVEELNKEEKSTVSFGVSDKKVIKEVSDGISDSSGLLKENYHSEPFKSQENETKSPKPSFHKILSVFGPTAGRKSTPDVNDMKEPRSHDKYLNKQSNHGVEDIQSDAGLGDQVPSTKNSKGIRKNQQQNKIVIKNEQNSNESMSKEVKKPRRSLLNVVDPLEVLQLTKDPILVKGKPASSDLGLTKELQAGRKPKVEIIKNQPDNKAKIAKINRAWDLNQFESSMHSVQSTQPNMPTNGSVQTANEVKPQSQNIPVPLTDVIPVSSIDDVEEGTSKSSGKNGADDAPVKLGNATFYAGTLTSASVNHQVTPIIAKADEEDIPVSSIDDDDDDGNDSSLLPLPEIIFEKNPEKIKSCFVSDRTKKNGKVTFFGHVFIHDYQSEPAATADWDFENGMAFGSYTPAAVKEYVEIDVTEEDGAPRASTVDGLTPPQDNRNDEPTIVYNEEDSLGFSESNDNTAGALLF